MYVPLHTRSRAASIVVEQKSSFLRSLKACEDFPFRGALFFFFLFLPSLRLGKSRPLNFILASHLDGNIFLLSLSLRRILRRIFCKLPFRLISDPFSSVDDILTSLLTNPCVRFLKEIISALLKQLSFFPPIFFSYLLAAKNSKD